MSIDGSTRGQENSICERDGQEDICQEYYPARNYSNHKVDWKIQVDLNKLVRVSAQVMQTNLPPDIVVS